MRSMFTSSFSCSTVLRASAILAMLLDMAAAGKGLKAGRELGRRVGWGKSGSPGGAGGGGTQQQGRGLMGARIGWPETDGWRARKTQGRERKRRADGGNPEAGQRRAKCAGRRGAREGRRGHTEAGEGEAREGPGKAGGKHGWEAEGQVEGGTEGQGHRCWIRVQVSSDSGDRAGARRGPSPGQLAALRGEPRIKIAAGRTQRGPH